MPTLDSVNMDSLTDGELLDAVREGNQDAYGILFSRHREPALRVARRHTPDRYLAEDAVNETFTAVLAAIKGGSGPVDVFSPYLLSSVTRTVHRLNRRSMRETPVIDAEVLDAEISDPTTAGPEFDGTAAREAFKNLPERWREVLWYIEIEEIPPRDAGPILGLSPNATVALHRRAKDGLRLSYLQQHVSTHGAQECKHMATHIPALVLGKIKRSQKDALESHLEDCKKCAAVLLQIQDLTRLQSAIIPLLATLPLSSFYPSSAHLADSKKRTKSNEGNARELLLIVSTALLITTALALCALGLFIPKSTDYKTANSGHLAADTSTSSPTASSLPSPTTEFEVIEHKGQATMAVIHISLPNQSFSPNVRLQVTPGSNGRISSIMPETPHEWTCAIAEDGSGECLSSFNATSRVISLNLTMQRPLCGETTPLAITISIPGSKVVRNSWENPCISD